MPSESNIQIGEAYDVQLITAVLSGDRTLELRIFGLQELTASQERRLTARLCRFSENIFQKLCH